MLVGNLTFYGRNMNELYEKVKQGNYKMPLWLSKEAVSFLNGMLQYDSNKRFSSDDLLRHDFLIKNVKDFQKVDKNQDQLKGKIQGNMMKINIRNNNTIWGLFNENNNFNSDKPLKEEATIKNAATMPNVEVSEKIMNNFDNQKQQQNIKNNAISFAQVKVIGNVKNPNNINNINNNRIISAKRPVMQNNQINQINQIKHINNNKPSQIPKTAISSNNRIQKKTTFENNMNIINQNNNNKINNNQKILYRTNIEPKHHHHHLQIKNENPQQFQNNQFNGQNNSNQVNISNNNFSNQQNFPNVSQMGDYCKNKNNALNEFF
jgi:serine/threonine protein kinase